MKILTFLFILIFIMQSCSTLTSGQYVQVKSGDSWSKLANEFSLKEWKLKAVNKNKRLLIDDWVFIPLKRGIIGRRQQSLYRVEDFFESGEFLWPVPSSKKVTSEFGKRWGRKHEGIDIAARKGTHIVAIADGVVVHSGSNLGGYGNLTVLAHKNGFFSVYAHARKNFTRKGDSIHQGQVIAEVGMTGKTSGPHLHFELRHESRAVNPLKFYALK